MTNAANPLTLTSGTSDSDLLEALQARLHEVEREYVNEKDRRAICERCKDARIKAGLNEQELADMLDPPVTDRTIRNYEKSRPPFKYLRQWAEITQTSYDWLLRGVEESQPAEPASQKEIQELRSRLEELAELVAHGFRALGVPEEEQLPGEDAPPRRMSRSVRR